MSLSGFDLAVLLPLLPGGTTRLSSISYSNIFNFFVSSVFSFHKFPRTIPRNKSIPRARLEVNLFQQSSGLWMSTVYI